MNIFLQCIYKQNFKTLDTISISAVGCRIRKIVTLKQVDHDVCSVPKTLDFPTGTEYATRLYEMEDKTKILAASKPTEILKVRAAVETPRTVRPKPLIPKSRGRIAPGLPRPKRTPMKAQAVVVDERGNEVQVFEVGSTQPTDQVPANVIESFGELSLKNFESAVDPDSADLTKPEQESQKHATKEDKCLREIARQLSETLQTDDDLNLPESTEEYDVSAYADSEETRPYDPSSYTEDHSNDYSLKIQKDPRPMDSVEKSNVIDIESYDLDELLLNSECLMDSASKFLSEDPY